MPAGRGRPHHQSRPTFSERRRPPAKPRSRMARSRIWRRFDGGRASSMAIRSSGLSAPSAPGGCRECGECPRVPSPHGDPRGRMAAPFAQTAKPAPTAAVRWRRRCAPVSRPRGVRRGKGRQSRGLPALAHQRRGSGAGADSRATRRDRPGLCFARSPRVRKLWRFQPRDRAARAGQGEKSDRCGF
jgi:hypothetical protein